jgi:opacity protein-like surface antigen
MQLLNNQLMKLVLLVVVAAAVLIGLNLNQKKVGRQNALLGSAAVVVVGGYLGYMLMEEKSEEVEDENTVPAPVENEVVVNEVVEGFQDNSGSTEPDAGADAAGGEPDADEEPAGVAGNEVSEGSVDETEENRNECLPRGVLNAEELLPSSYSSNNWDTPANPGGIDGPNFLNPEHLVGINTVGQSLRNANRQLRSEPPNPQVKVSPWLQTTIEPDTNRKPMEIGENCA